MASLVAQRWACRASRTLQHSLALHVRSFSAAPSAAPAPDAGAAAATAGTTAGTTAAAPRGPDDPSGWSVDVVAHRGASGRLPGHTLAAYEEAVRAGTDWVELDVHATKCGSLVVAHDIEYGGATNIASLPQFADRRSVKTAPCQDGEPETLDGWFVSDLTVAEAKTLQVHTDYGRTAQSGKTSSYGVNLEDEAMFKVPTVFEAATLLQRKRDEISRSGVTIRKHDGRKVHMTGHIPFKSALSDQMEAKYQQFQEFGGSAEFVFPLNNRYYSVSFNTMRQTNLSSGYERVVWRHNGRWHWIADENPEVGLYIETKRPWYYRNMVGVDVEQKLVEDIETSKFDGPVMIQSFEEESLRRIATMRPDWKLVKLWLEEDVPHNVSDLGPWLAAVADYANGIGISKTSVVPDPTNAPESSAVVDMAHELNLFVHCYTFRTDVQFLHRVYGGNASLEFVRFFRLGVDGVFADFPDHAVYATHLYEQFLRKGGDCGDAAAVAMHLIRNVAAR